jgi:hypothetical protein
LILIEIESRALFFSRLNYVFNCVARWMLHMLTLGLGLAFCYLMRGARPDPI